MAKSTTAAKEKTTTAVPVLVTDHGPCVDDCGNIVDVVVDVSQVAGGNRLRCVECRAKRIKEKADADIGALKEKATAAREEAVQGKLEFPAE